MEENITDAQRQEIIRKRQEMLAKMGVPNGGKTVMESVVNTGNASSSMAARIAAIRNGSAREELNKYISATGKSGGADGGPSASGGGFQALPEPKMKRGPSQDVKPEYKQKLEDFGGPTASVNSELSSIEALFGGDGGSRSSGGGNQFQQNLVNTNFDIDSARMPTFNPHAALQKKLREKEGQGGNNFQEEFVPVNPGNAVGQPQFNVQQLQVMMETIAKGIAEKTIKNVLNEYSEQQKNKNYFEYYNKEKTVIKMSDGKLYRLQQVQLKQK